MHKCEEETSTRVRQVVVVDGEIVTVKKNNHRTSRPGKESIEKEDIRQEGAK